MPLLPAYQASLAAAFFIIGIVSGQPQIAYPVNSQLPPVAYAHQPFEFVFSPLTFSSDASGISYALSNQPDWVHLDNDTRKLEGTPTIADLGAPKFQLLASDHNGQTSSSVTLVVLERKALSAGSGILSQLAQAGNVSTPATLLLHTSEPFTFKVTPHVFNGISADTVFYAVSSDGSPLPSWIQFNSQTITFSGKTLPLPAPEPPVLEYSFSLVASDVLGFSESKIDFTIVTTDRLLTFANPYLNVSVSKGRPVTVGSLLDQVFLDGVLVSRNEIDNVTSDSPSWLRLNSDDVSFSGIAPDDISNTSFSIGLSCSGTNAANATVQLQVSQEHDNTTIDLGSADATEGTYFSFQLNQPNLPTSHAQIGVDFGNFSSWLSYTAANQTIHGLVPMNEPGTTQSLNITFNGSVTATAILVLTVREGPSAPSTTSSAIGPANTNPITSSDHLRKVYPVVLATVLPISAVILLILIVTIWTRKRRQQQQEMSQRSKLGYISSPQPGPSPNAVERMPSAFVVAERGVRMHQDAGGAPRLELPWAANSPTRTRRRRSRRPNLSQGSIIGPSWDDLLNFDREGRDTLSSVPKNSGAGIEVRQVRSPLRNKYVRDSGKHAAARDRDRTVRDLRLSRVSQALGNERSQAVGLPQRMSGAGHGTRVGNVLMSPDPRSSWQTTQGSIPIMIDGSRPSTVLLDAFPVPPSQGGPETKGKSRGDSPRHDSRPTPRWVESEGSSSSSFEAAKQYYYNQSAWNRLAGTAPLSNSAIRVISNPRATAAAGGLSGRSSSLWPRPSATAAAVSDHTQPPLAQSSNGGQRVSAASSHQFDSAISSDSQWEDEDLTAEEIAAGEMYWQNTRLPFEAFGEAQPGNRGGGAGAGAGAGSGQPRLADQRRQVNVEATEAGSSNPSKSHKGSFRFV